MSNVHRFPMFLLALGALVSLAFAAPAAAQVEQEPLAVPADLSWDETSGYGAVEATRATIGYAPAVPSWDDVSGYGSVEASRAAVPEVALGASWDETSGYGAVEASRASIGQDPSWDETSGYGSVEASRASR